ncbi:hypothetical protein PSECIP111854_01188 [Pseudoalteromonas sp. CIP111854]|uniref:DUF2846 domain-containing protein n=1 Tax=Pseudoalteromonas holothuriae TaxID=2963714 RepID=A0A9W4QUD0_9GAMM|nr:hypothetical protein [Pseudoalteromonas sp. CIP111854]CAH9053529.1 hypothetical protein PSECIP111854_01188 [Pseudoalteromonas sp. CIP111854]
MRFILTIILAFSLVGCAAQVTSIKSDKDKIDSADAGYLLLGVDTSSDLKSILITGPKNIKLSPKDLRKGSNFILVDLKPGIYTIEKIELNNYWRLEMEDKKYWNLEISSGVINYVGHIKIKSKNFWDSRYHTELVNKSSYAIEFLQRKFPNILAKRSVHYGGPGDDSFFTFLTSHKKEGN